MARLSTNVVVSFAARGWSALLSLLAVPIYIKFIGVEAYGLIGVFVSLQTFLSLLDFGLGTALTREIARASDAGQGIRDLVKTLEIVFFVVALFSLAAIYFVAPFIAHYWLKPKSISTIEITNAILVAGVSFACQWPGNLYSGGLTGLQKQVHLACVAVFAGTLRVACTILALWLLEPSLRVFFGAQALCNLLQTIVTRKLLWKGLSISSENATFKAGLLRDVSGFASGMAGIALTTIVLTQFDKAILSKILSLESFGYYVTAGTLAGGLYVLVTPLFAAVFPRFSSLASQNNVDEVRNLYHTSAQVMSVMILPVALVGVFFAHEIFRIWTGSEIIAKHCSSIFALLMVGNAMNGLMNVPYALQLAHGWTRLAFFSNVAAIVICGPLIYFLSLRLGAIGGALAWVVLTCGYIVTSQVLMHRRLLRGQQWRWYLVDVGAPGLGAMAIVAVGAKFLKPLPPTNFSILVLAGLLLCAVLAALIAAPSARKMAIQNVLHRPRQLRAAG